MTSTMYIGSGDVAALLAGKHTKAHKALMQRFVSGVKPYYNALASPIDALRTGAILEERFFLTLPDGWYPQYKVVCKEMDVLKASLDFACLNRGKVVDFIELKSISFGDFLQLESVEEDKRVDYVKKVYKTYYNQVQQQLYCTGLNEATLCFLCVYSYDDDDNRTRDIGKNDILKVCIKRDDDVIDKIKDRATIFQLIKNSYNE